MSTNFFSLPLPTFTVKNITAVFFHILTHLTNFAAEWLVFLPRILEDLSSTGLLQYFCSLPHCLKIQPGISVLNTPRPLPSTLSFFFRILFIRYHVENADEKRR